ncbi:hypothetical protein G9O61_00g022280 [Vairimorpha ceranae]|nr:hypothetical protein G9O61_00g022280 [Vairimorpha ceranae]
MNIWFFIITLETKREIVEDILIEIHFLIFLYDDYKVDEDEFKIRLLCLIHSVSAANCCCIDNCEYNSFVTDIVEEHSEYLNKIFY